jgi:hypothetical protein
MDKRNIKTGVNYRNTLMQKKQTKRMKMIGNDNYKHRTLGLPKKNTIIVIVIIKFK